MDFGATSFPISMLISFCCTKISFTSLKQVWPKLQLSLLSFSFDMRNNTKHWTTSELNEQASFYVNRTGRYTKSGVEIVQSYLQIKGTIYFHKNKLLFRWHIQFHEKSYLYFFLSKVSNGKMLGFIDVEWTFFRLQLVT